LLTLTIFFVAIALKTPKIRGMDQAPRSKQRPVPIVVAGVLQHLGRRVTLARKLRGWTQQDLGQLADVSTSTVRAIEKGADGVGLGHFIKVLQALGLHDQLDHLLDPRLDPETVAYAERTLQRP
jgi:DNA-binding XRE family transcriptional regulator